MRPERPQTRPYPQDRPVQAVEPAGLSTTRLELCERVCSDEWALEQVEAVWEVWEAQELQQESLERCWTL